MVQEEPKLTYQYSGKDLTAMRIQKFATSEPNPFTEEKTAVLLSLPVTVKGRTVQCHATLDCIALERYTKSIQ